MSKRDTIYVALPDEGIDVPRPVEAERLSPDRRRHILVATEAARHTVAG